MPNQSSNSNNNLVASSLNLPKGGGTIQGLGESVGSVGPMGMASMSIPLPISSGRGYVPDLSLSYSSGSGNSEFGLGWSLPLMKISRRTNRGVPHYTDQDEFIGPDGEVMVPARNASGNVISRTCNQYNDKPLNATYTVTQYLPRIEAAFSLIEYWCNDTTPEDNFWLIHQADGQLHCLGKTPIARTANPTDNTHIAEWWLEESVSPTHEHIVYLYKAEDTSGIELSGPEAKREHGALSYLAQVRFGNSIAAKHLYAWDNNAENQTYLFTLVFDYGERGLDPLNRPNFDSAGSPWLPRQDSFSGYHFGFETRCHRLCRQVLMLHHFPVELGEDATLVSRLMLNYEESPVISQLSNAQLWTYDEAGMGFMNPPLSLNYIPFKVELSAEGWQTWPGSPGLDNGQPYQIIDLYGEGVPGLLYQHNKAWYYQSPVRDTQSGLTDGVTYSDWQCVPQVATATTGSGLLMDMTGDGRYNWIVALPGCSGFFTINSDKTWRGFTPFNAIPNELFHPQAQLLDLVGDGLTDIALVGPKSVRLYANVRDGFDTGHEVNQPANITLPSLGRDPSALIGFSDILGSGQQHLIEVRYNKVKCWPNLGRGYFGQVLEFECTPFDTQERFNPNQLFLLDIDGSGAVDIVYASSNQLALYLNQSGNGFADPCYLPLPPDVHFDQLCQLTAADLSGKGVAQLILTKPYMQTQHWYYTFCQEKPYLLSGLNNNMGADTRFTYRSSAQFWLDEKQEDSSRVSYLPFPMHLVHQVIQTDEVTNNKLSQSYTYKKGIYDGQEREFRGFGLVEGVDTNDNSKPTGEDIAFTPPVLTKTWYHTGYEEDENTHLLQGWNEDAEAYTITPTRLTQWLPSAASEDDFAGDGETQWWLYRALRGMPLRIEIYGNDNSEKESTPYTVSSFRYQSRLIQEALGSSSPVVFPSQLETLTYQYERILNDPQVLHQITLSIDRLGFPTHLIAIAYPRRKSVTAAVYPDALPETAVESSYDDQQLKLRLSEQLQRCHHLQNNMAWQLGIIWQQRQNAYVIDTPTIPADTGYNFEALIDPGSHLNTEPAVYAGQTVAHYTDAMPSQLPVLLDHIETVTLDEQSLQAYEGILDSIQLEEKLLAAGYVKTNKVLGDDAADEVWMVQSNFFTYFDEDTFFKRHTQQQTSLTGALTYYYNSYGFLSSMEDSMSSTVSVEQFNYRFLSPMHIVDINQNSNEVAFDSFGRVTVSSFYGTEKGEQAGFEPINGFTPPATVNDLIIISNSTDVLPVAMTSAYDAFSWMGRLPKSEVDAIDMSCWSAMLSEGLLLTIPYTNEYAYITAKGHYWAVSENGLLDYNSTVVNALKSSILTIVRIPSHAATLQPDRYPDDLGQQKRVSVVYNDGFGRVVHTSRKDEPGLAYVRTPEGELEIAGDGSLVEETSDPRWSVSGRVEYNNKGLTVRQYQPYFINDWQYVVDTAMRTQGYADTHFYDALGRAHSVINAKGYIRRLTYYPWFVVSEDENDTLVGWTPRYEEVVESISIDYNLIDYDGLDTSCNRTNIFCNSMAEVRLSSRLDLTTYSSRNDGGVEIPMQWELAEDPIAKVTNYQLMTYATDPPSQPLWLIQTRTKLDTSGVLSPIPRSFEAHPTTAQMNSIIGSTPKTVQRDQISISVTPLENDNEDKTEELLMVYYEVKLKCVTQDVPDLHFFVASSMNCAYSEEDSSILVSELPNKTIVKRLAPELSIQQTDLTSITNVQHEIDERLCYAYCVIDAKNITDYNVMDAKNPNKWGWSQSNSSFDEDEWIEGGQVYWRRTSKGGINEVKKWVACFENDQNAANISSHTITNNNDGSPYWSMQISSNEPNSIAICAYLYIRDASVDNNDCDQGAYDGQATCEFADRYGNSCEDLVVTG
ncbi:SpvB/TcaC N-terminal domain-containing protein [Zooshikella sp. RANM57]|uniref:SpvB/TcaC N-terminal domain-containing protein n=1 Tax=Zooshikella sp. RANM57 TaxID=3425863 RepID=UPI003D700F38